MAKICPDTPTPPPTETLAECGDGGQCVPYAECESAQTDVYGGDAIDLRYIIYYSVVLGRINIVQ